MRDISCRMFAIQRLNLFLRLNITDKPLPNEYVRPEIISPLQVMCFVAFKSANMAPARISDVDFCFKKESRLITVSTPDQNIEKVSPD